MSIFFSTSSYSQFSARGCYIEGKTFYTSSNILIEKYNNSLVTAIQHIGYDINPQFTVATKFGVNENVGYFGIDATYKIIKYFSVSADFHIYNGFAGTKISGIGNINLNKYTILYSGVDFDISNARRDLKSIKNDLELNMFVPIGVYSKISKLFAGYLETGLNISNLNPYFLMGFEYRYNPYDKNIKKEKKIKNKKLNK